MVAFETIRAIIIIAVGTFIGTFFAALVRKKITIEHTKRMIERWNEEIGNGFEYVSNEEKAEKKETPSKTLDEKKD